MSPAEEASGVKWERWNNWMPEAARLASFSTWRFFSFINSLKYIKKVGNYNEPFKDGGWVIQTENILTTQRKISFQLKNTQFAMEQYCLLIKHFSTAVSILVAASWAVAPPPFFQRFLKYIYFWRKCQLFIFAGHAIQFNNFNNLLTRQDRKWTSVSICVQ